MMRHLHVTLALLLATLLTGVAQGEILLFQRAISVNRSENIFDTDQFDLDLTFGDDFFDPNNGVTLFDDLVISPADIGSTYDATLASDPNNFPTAAARLTDAINEVIRIALTEYQVGGLPEYRGSDEELFFGHPTPPGPPDLAGSTVDRVSLRLDNFVFLSSAAAGGPAPVIEGQPFDVSLTLSIYSAIPEPTAIRLLLLGLLGVGVRPFCRQR
jgi:hypothetical protein